MFFIIQPFRKLTWKSINVLVLFVLLKSFLIVKTLRFHFKNTLKENISIFLNLKVKDPQQFVSVSVFCYDYTVFDVIFSVSMTAEIAQLGERRTEDLKVPGSNPENSHEF